MNGRMSDAPFHVGIFISTMGGGGAQRAMLNLAQGLVERNCRVDLILARAEGPLLDEARASVNVVDLKASRVVTALPGLVRYLRKQRPDALVSAMDYVSVVALWARRLAGVSTRLAVSEQNTLSIVSRHSPRLRQRVMPFLVRRFYHWADGIVPNSEGVLQDLQQVTGLPPDRFTLIHNPMVTPQLAERVRETPEHPWFQVAEVPVVLAVGRLEPQKDYPTLIRAFAEVRQRRPARLLILGEGAERPRLEALASELGVREDVELPGFAANPYAFMARASCFVLSSRWEGLPGVLVEALFCGPPLVSTDCPSGAREILADGRYGKLVPVEDVGALAAAVELALDGGVSRPPRESWDRFSLETVTTAYLQLLRGGS